MVKHNKNIRATAFKEFWGDDFDESLYLWEGAKSNLTLSEIEKSEIPTLQGILVTKDEVKNVHDYCNKIYFKFLPLLAAKLNEINKLDLPVLFWRVAFGSWLLRHICLVYDKYLYLSQLNIDQTSIKLLDKKSFYIPDDHYDYGYCFSNDFGVQQLVSQYYYLFAKKQFPCISKVCSLTKEERELYHHINLIVEKKEVDHKELSEDSGSQRGNDPKIAICGAYFSSKVLNMLTDKSKGEIQWMDLPRVKTNQTQISIENRKKLIDIDAQDKFEKFLLKTFCYCFPKILIEHFRDYYEQFLKDIQKKRFTHIVSEVWVSFLPTSIYLAIAQNQGKKLIFQQHGASSQWRFNNRGWMGVDVADKFLTTGWKNNNKKIVRGGFSCIDTRPYKYKPWKNTILYVSSTRCRYRCSFGPVINNKEMLNYLKTVRDFIDLLPEYIYKYFTLRPRNEKYFWDTEHALELNKKKIQIAGGAFSDIISESKIIIIDHLSTGIAEILFNNIPCLIIHNCELEPLADEYTNLFNDLIRCGVVHNSAKSAIAQLIKIYDNVEQWWSGDSVQQAVKDIVANNLSSPLNTVDFLLSCLKETGDNDNCGLNNV